MGLICDHHTLSGGGQVSESAHVRTYRELWELAACTHAASVGSSRLAPSTLGKGGGGRVCDPARVNHASDPKGSRFPNQSGDRVLNVDLGTAAVASRSQVSTR